MHAFNKILAINLTRLFSKFKQLVLSPITLLNNFQNSVHMKDFQYQSHWFS